MSKALPTPAKSRHQPFRPSFESQTLLSAEIPPKTAIVVAFEGPVNL